MYIKVRFIDQNSIPLEIEHKINITLVINESITFKKRTRYSVQTRDRIFIKGYDFLSFAENMGRNNSKNLSSKFSQKLFDHDKKSATDTLRTSSKIVIQKTAESTGNKIADKITRVLKTSPLNN